MLVHTVVKQIEFLFVQGFHVPPEKYIEGLLGMETTHFADGVVRAPPVYYLPFYIDTHMCLMLCHFCTWDCYNLFYACSILWQSLLYTQHKSQHHYQMSL